MDAGMESRNVFATAVQCGDRPRSTIMPGKRSVATGSPITRPTTMKWQM